MPSLAGPSWALAEELHMLLQVYGLCLGLFIGSLTNVGFYSYLVITTPWEKVSLVHWPELRPGKLPCSM